MSAVYKIRQSPASVRLAKELTSIATNIDFRDLRTDMVTSRIIQETDHLGTSPEEVTEFVARLMGALEMVMLTVEVLADDIAGTSGLRTVLDELTKHPEFEEWVRRAKDDAKLPRELRRPARVDEQLREVDGL